MLESSTRAASSVAPGASRPNNSVMRCVRAVFIIAREWCGLDTIFAMTCVSSGYGTDGSRTPTTVADRGPRRMVWPITDGSLWSTVVQNRCERTEQDAPNHTENRRVGADAQSKRHHHSGGQGLGTGKGAQGITYIPPKCLGA